MPANLGLALRHAGDREGAALIDLGGEAPPREFTAQQIDDMSDAVARGLKARGLQVGDRVAIISTNRAELFVSYLGAMRAGMVAVPVNFKLPAEIIKYVLDDADAKLVMCDAARRPLCPPNVPCLVFNGTGAESFTDFLDPGPFDAVVPAPRAPAMYLYTSGSTGRPKGVVLSHESQLWTQQMKRAKPGRPRQRVLVAAPMFHMQALIVAQSALFSGDTVVLMPTFTSAGYIDAIERYRVNVLTSVPTMIAMIMQDEERLAKADLSSVRVVHMGSAPLPASLVDAVPRVFPGAIMVHSYGTTETGPVVFTAHPGGKPTPPTSVGTADPNVQSRLVGGAGPEEGVLEVKSPGLMSEYHNLPDMTRAVMTADGYYNTKDIFRRDADGFHYFVGRADDMFVCGGENIYPEEVERMLERHPAVRQACVVPVADELKGFKPVAFVVLAEGASATAEELKAFSLKHAAAYQHPRHVWFLDAMPLAGTDKVDRNLLKRNAGKLAQEANRQPIGATEGS